MKFIIGGLLILAAVVYLIVSSSSQAAEYYVTIDELLARKSDSAGQAYRVVGVVLGDTITHDESSFIWHFTIANIPADMDEIQAQGGMAAVLHRASTDPSQSRLNVTYKGVKPDLLKNEAQAVVTGRMNADGSFAADELLLKCPTKYEDAAPQASSGL